MAPLAVDRRLDRRSPREFSLGPTLAKTAIDYDANDHATVVDDGATRISETLSPAGRVLHRVVTDNVTGTVREDTKFGYDAPATAPPTVVPVRAAR